MSDDDAAVLDPQLPSGRPRRRRTYIGLGAAALVVVVVVVLAVWNARLTAAPCSCLPPIPEQTALVTNGA